MSLHARVMALVGTVALMSSISGCRNDGPSGPVGGAFELGQSLSVGRGRDARVLGSTTGGIFYAVVVNSGLDSVGQAGFTLRATGIQSPEIPPLDRIPLPPDEGSVGAAPRRDQAFESRLRDVERAALTPRFAAARQWNAARVPSLPTTLAVGDLVTVNVNATDPCTNPQYHVARVMAIGTKALVLNDTLNPKSGFSTADYQRYESSGEINFTVADAAQCTEAVLKSFGARIHSLDHVDGVTADLGDGSWFNLRSSNTEPLLRLNVEARTAEDVAAVVAQISGEIDATSAAVRAAP